MAIMRFDETQHGWAGDCKALDPALQLPPLNAARLPTIPRSPPLGRCGEEDVMGFTSAYACLSLRKIVVAAWLLLIVSPPAFAIEVNMTMESAKAALAEGRASMEQASDVESVATVMKALEQRYRVGANPEEDPCGPHAILRTRRYWLEYFGRREAAESKRLNRPIRMPENKIQEILNMPYLEVEVRLCGDEEFFAEGAEIALQQGSNIIRPVDVGPAERGRKNPGPAPSYRSRFTARFAYADFDPQGKSILAVFFPDGKLINIEADFSKIP